MRRAFLTAPIHAVRLPGFFIGKNEVTFEEYVAWLNALPPVDRKRRRPSLASHEGALELTESPRGWTLTLKPTVSESQARWGEPLTLTGRSERQSQDWRRFPVTAVSFDDAQAFAGWLNSTGRVPKARLCSEQEWERAARGLDGRVFTTGATLRPADTNIDVTYGRKGFGPDEVGSHPASTSPWGIEDMEGNALEMLLSFREGETAMARGGSWYYESMSARLDLRYPIEPNTRSVFMGFRVCADSN
jgi:formylglycine-generating enzyme required for sulfatase activity